MYSNAFDSVRTKDTDLINTNGLLYVSILNGMHPTFTLNQAVDSISFLNISLGSPVPLEFVSNGVIRVAKHKVYRDKNNQELDAITGYMVDALRPVENRHRNPYRFSSLQFLYKNYEDKQIQKIYDEMLKVIVNDLVYGDHVHFDSHLGRDIGIENNSGDIDKIDEYLQFVLNIRKAVNGHYIPPVEQQSYKKLSERLIESIHFYRKDEDKSSFHEGLDELEILIEKERERTNLELINKRSVIYDFIEKELRCGQSMGDEMKALVDLCYNKVVADSIADDEKSILTNDIKHHDAEKYFKTTGNELTAQELMLIKKTEGFDSNHVTWDKLKGILDNVHVDRSHTEKWIEAVEDYCCQVKLNNVKLSANGLIRGAFTFPIMVARFCKLANYVLNEDWGLAIIAFYDALDTVRNSITKIASGVEITIDAYRENKEYSQIENLLTDIPKLKK